jgi:predicted DNA-binding transcriptional regulator AlpA
MDRLLNTRSTAELIGTSERALERWRVTGEGPAFVRVGPRRVGYRLRDIEAWLEARAFPHRAAELACKAAA